jgi:hypothetical protein
VILSSRMVLSPDISSGRAFRYSGCSLMLGILVFEFVVVILLIRSFRVLVSG